MLKLHWTFTWVLRLFFLQFAIGLYMVGAASYLLATWPSSEVFKDVVPLVYSFGKVPYLALVAIGALMVAVAWNRGRRAKEAAFTLFPDDAEAERQGA